MRQPGLQESEARLNTYPAVWSSALLEAEVLSTLARERVDPGPALSMLSLFHFVLPSRRLTEEIQAVLQAGLIKGADLHHLASALYLRTVIPALDFLTSDRNQARLAKYLGFGSGEYPQGPGSSGALAREPLARYGRDRRKSKRGRSAGRRQIKSGSQRSIL